VTHKASTGMSRAEILETYALMKTAQEQRLEPGQGKVDATGQRAHVRTGQMPIYDGAEKAVTLGGFLKSLRCEDPRAEDERLTALLWTNARDAHVALEESKEAYERACADRGWAYAQLVDAGQSQAEIARVMGLTRAAVNKAIRGHR
jgi:hypothetical protein